MAQRWLNLGGFGTFDLARLNTSRKRCLIDPHLIAKLNPASTRQPLFDSARQTAARSSAPRKSSLTPVFPATLSLADFLCIAASERR
jgi:hypothetical protein